MEQAIKDAKGAGWNDKHAYFYCPLSGDEQDHALIDPSFWKALGVARSWYKDGLDMHEWHVGTFKPEWLEKWHRLIDALAAGKTPEEFFASLV